MGNVTGEMIDYEIEDLKRQNGRGDVARVDAQLVPRQGEARARAPRRRPGGEGGGVAMRARAGGVSRAHRTCGRRTSRSRRSRANTRARGVLARRQLAARGTAPPGHTGSAGEASLKILARPSPVRPHRGRRGHTHEPARADTHEERSCHTHAPKRAESACTRLAVRAAPSSRTSSTPTGRRSAARPPSRLRRFGRIVGAQASLRRPVRRRARQGQGRGRGEGLRMLVEAMKKRGIDTSKEEEEERNGAARLRPPRRRFEPLRLRLAAAPSEPRGTR